MTRLLRLLLCCWLLQAATASATSLADMIDTPRLVSVGDDESIPESVVTALAEDRDGFVWIGTPAGLIRYDGYRFRRFVHRAGDPTSLAGNLVRSLLPTRDGRLWVGTDVDGVAIYDPREDHFRTLRHDPEDPHGLGAGAIFAMIEDADGQVWMSTRGSGLQRVDPVSGRVTRYRRDDEDRPGPLSDHITELLHDRHGRLWIGTAAGLNRLDEEQDGLAVVASDPTQAGSLAKEMVFTLFEASDGRLWLATRGGRLALLDPDSETLTWIDDDPQENDQGSIIYDIRELPEGEFWLARSDGIEIRDRQARLQRRLRHNPANPGGLAGHDVRVLLLDRAGMLWLGGYGVGLQRHDPRTRAFGLLHSQASRGVLADPNVSALLHSRDGAIWLGTRGGGLAVLDAALTPSKAFPAETSPADWITSFAEDRDGSVWIGSREGLFRHRPDAAQLELVPTWQGAAGQVRRLLLDRHGALWIAGAGGLLRRGVDGELAAQEQDGGRIQGDINAMVEDTDGTIWVGATLGLLRRTPGDRLFQPVYDEQASPPLPASIVGLLIDRRGTLWVDTSEGLFRRSSPAGAPTRFEPISARYGDGLHAFGASLLDDDQGRIWSAHQMFDPQRKTMYTLSRADGVDIGTPWFRSYSRGTDGRLWFGGSKGVLVVDPQRFRAWDHAPPTVLTDLRIDGRPAFPRDPSQALRLTPPQRQFAIEFAALDYSAPERLRYRYRLHGYDEDWIDSPEGQRGASYGNLWPGRYRLEVQGSNRLGEFSPHGLQWDIEVAPAFWQRPAFAALVALAALALLYALGRWRSAQADRRATRLRHLVEQRTGELREAKERAESTLAELQNAQQQLVAAEKMASLGQLVAGVAHEINTPIGIAVTAASHLQELTEANERRFNEGKLSRSEFEAWRRAVIEGMQLVLGSLDRAHTLIASFKQVAVDQSSEQRRPIVLRRFLDDVRAALQPSFRRAGHRMSIDCAEDLELDSYPGALFQIFTNLVTNSQVHGYAEGEAGCFSISARRDGEQIVLHYRDDGKGMSPEVAAQAFEPFFTTRRGSGGSGLGLHLVYNLATQLLGGSIRLYSAPGKGCEVVLRIPRMAPARSTGPYTSMRGGR